MALSTPTQPHQPTNSDDHLLSTVLLQRGWLTPDQLQTAHRYSTDHRLGLRQSIVELNLLPQAQLNTLAFEHLAALGDEANPPANAAAPRPLTGPFAPPDRNQLERDIRNELREIAATATPPDLAAEIFGRAFEFRATDIHFDSQENRYRVRYRIDSQLHDVLDLDPALAVSLVSRIKLMANMDIVERRHAQDGRMTIPYRDRPRDLRVATLPTAFGEKVVVRIHEALIEAPSFDQLGLNPAQVEILTKLSSRPYGALLVTGPVGSGKTTTLYSCLRRVNQPTRNVMTIEDPIEYRLQGVNQTQVDTRIDLTFSQGLRAMLRQDPDVLMIGEIRDQETASIGMRAALTGVLVFSSTHASDSANTIGNFYNFGIPGYVLTSILGLVSQRLVRKICPYCRVQYPADEATLVAMDLDPNEHQGLTLHRGAGCNACFGTGYLGRTGIFEIMEIGADLRELIFQQVSKDVLRQVAVGLGMQTLKQSAVDKILDGTTTVEEMYRVVSI